MQRFVEHTVTLMLALLAFGCAARPLYQAVKLTDPSPFTRPGCRLAIEDVRADHLSVEGKTEAEWLSTRTARQQASYEQDKRTGQAKLSEYVQKKQAALLVAPGTQGDNVFILRPIFTDWDPGAYGFFGGRPAMARMIFDVVDSAGNVLDELAFEGKTLGFSSGERMWSAYVTAAWAIDQYLDDRWSCARP